jgi:hypothetical protein
MRRGKAVPPVSDLLQLTEPQVSRLTDMPTWIDDKDTQAFILASQPQYVFNLVCLVCDFTPKKDERIDEAWISVSLTRSDGGTPLPVARSIEPVRLPFNRKTTRTAKLSTNLHLVNAEVGGDVETGQQLLSIVGHPTPESAPNWKLKDLPEHPLDGPEILKLLVQMPLGAQGTGAVKIQATVRRQRFLLPDQFLADAKDPGITTFLLR